jgi:hypothetical protein
MLENFLHNHTRTVVDDKGQQTIVPATCAEVNRRIVSHVAEVLVDDGQGGLKVARQVVSCADIESELARLHIAEVDLTSQVGRLTGQVDELTRERDNGNRLMNGAIQVIFGMGPALHGLLSDDLGVPELTADRSAVKLEGAAYTVVIDVFRERILVRAAVDDTVVPEKTFRVYDGILDEDGRTLLLGHVTRIKAVVASGADPVRESINLVDRPAATV